MEKKKQLLGDEIIESINAARRKGFEDALNTCHKLGKSENVTDGELLDALFTFASNLDLANPLLPIASEIFQRYMDKIEMAETPAGIKREWYEEAKQKYGA